MNLLRSMFAVLSFLKYIYNVYLNVHMMMSIEFFLAFLIFWLFLMCTNICVCLAGIEKLAIKILRNIVLLMNDWFAIWFFIAFHWAFAWDVAELRSLFSSKKEKNRMDNFGRISVIWRIPLVYIEPSKGHKPTSCFLNFQISLAIMDIEVANFFH